MIKTHALFETGRLYFESIESISLVPAAMVALSGSSVEPEDDAHNSRSECTYYIDLYSSGALGRIVSVEIGVKPSEDLIDTSSDVVLAPVSFSPLELFTESGDLDTLCVEVKRLTSECVRLVEKLAEEEARSTALQAQLRELTAKLAEASDDEPSPRRQQGRRRCSKGGGTIRKLQW